MLVLSAGLFDHERYLHEVPSISLAIGLLTAGVLALYLPRCVAQSEQAPKETLRHLLVHIIAGGIVLRLMMFWTVPALETDLYRYLWDGALVATQHNPYAYSPGDLGQPDVPQTVRDLSIEAGYIHDRINHSELRTVYPPIAQAFFALAYFAETWSITAWRLVCFLSELTTLWLLIRLLDELGRSRLWIALYWWNPLIIKELMNSAHIEAILIPFILAAVLLAIVQRYVLSSIVMALAVGIKVWPLLFLPIILRSLWRQPRRFAVALVLTSVCLLALALPPLLAGLDQKSGFVAYASEWRRNGALNPILEALFATTLSPFGVVDASIPNQLARGLAASIALAFAILVAIPVLRGPHDLVERMSWVALAVFLLSPAQYPWYLAWILPFMALRTPLIGVLIASAVLPTYYISFYFRSQNVEWVYNDVLVYGLWIPIWFAIYQDIKKHLGTHFAGSSNSHGSQ